jgi:hypothetical protein
VVEQREVMRAADVQPVLLPERDAPAPSTGVQPSSRASRAP